MSSSAEGGGEAEGGCEEREPAEESEREELTERTDRQLHRARQRGLSVCVFVYVE